MSFWVQEILVIGFILLLNYVVYISCKSFARSKSLLSSVLSLAVLLGIGFAYHYFNG